jgi:hypothetical protein
MKRPTLLPLLLAVGLLPGVARAAAPARAPAAAPVFNFDLNANRRELTLVYKGLPLLVYVFGTNQFKPYVRELYSLHGVNVLRDSPPDHQHHHGLMYAIKVNGTNFWEETPGCGYQRPARDLLRKIGRNPSGLPTAALTQTIYWVTPDHASLPDPAPAALLVESRTLRLTVDEAAGEVALAWRGDFTVGPASPRITLGGAAYHGLGLRLPQDFDKAALHQNAAGLPYTAEQKWDVTPATWACASGTVGGRNLMVALFSHPSDAGSPRFFSMLDAFAYLSATQGLDTAPIEYAAGDRFSVRYLLTIYPVRKEKEFLAERYSRWAAE